MGGEKKCESSGGGGEKGTTPTDPPQKKQLKACCACPETKTVRDACIVEMGEEHCKPLIQAHLDCMRKMGFNI